MKDAKGHGSDSRGGESVGDLLYRLMKPPSMIPGYKKLELPAHQSSIRQITTVANADAIVGKLRAGVVPNSSNVTRTPGWIERFGAAARKTRG